MGVYCRTQHNIRFQLQAPLFRDQQCFPLSTNIRGWTPGFKLRYNMLEAVNGITRLESMQVVSTVPQVCQGMVSECPAFKKANGTGNNPVAAVAMTPIENQILHGPFQLELSQYSKTTNPFSYYIYIYISALSMFIRQEPPIAMLEPLNPIMEKTP